jgi:hypothetical protein
MGGAGGRAGVPVAVKAATLPTVLADTAAAASFVGAGSSSARATSESADAEGDGVPLVAAAVFSPSAENALPAPPPAALAPALAAEPHSELADDRPPRGGAAALLAWFASPAARLWFPDLSPVLAPLPLLCVLGGASLCAGVLNGMLGAGGPPLMLAYSFLQLDKEILRGFGVVPSVFMVLRLLLYVAAPNGVFEPEREAAGYALIAVAAAGGSAAGGRMRASCSATALLRAILALVWLSGWSMLGAFAEPLPAALFGALSAAWLLLLAVAARWPREFAAVRGRLCPRRARGAAATAPPAVATPALLLSPLPPISPPLK